MKLKLLRIICLATLGLLLFDNMTDAAGCDGPKAATEVCHSCACGPHLVSPAVASGTVVPAPAPYISYEPLPYSFLFPSSVFRPPCAAA